MVSIFLDFFESGGTRPGRPFCQSCHLVRLSAPQMTTLTPVTLEDSHPRSAVCTDGLLRVNLLHLIVSIATPSGPLAP